MRARALLALVPSLTQASVALALCAGLLAAVANAWYCMDRTRPPYATLVNERPAMKWPVIVPGDWPKPTYASAGRDRWVICRIWRAESTGPVASTYEVSEYDAGWPTPFMRARTVERRDSTGSGYSVGYQSNFLTSSVRMTISAQGSMTRVRPLQPIGVPFVLHWLIMSTLCFPLVFLPLAAMRVVARHPYAPLEYWAHIHPRTRALLLLLPALLLTVANGWYFASHPARARPARVPANAGSRPLWPSRILSKWPDPSESVTESGAGWSSTHMAAEGTKDPSLTPDKPTFEYTRTRSGWPFALMQDEWAWTNDTTPPAGFRMSNPGGMNVTFQTQSRSEYEYAPYRLTLSYLGPFALGRGVVLPLQPLFPGFPLHFALVWACLWGVQFPLLAKLRWRYARLGRCRQCGYDLAGCQGQGARCPECGTPSPGHTRTDSTIPS
ncbi:MAG: hypothetical protein U0637_04450 [Phycisphaerales bacterium]